MRRGLLLFLCLLAFIPRANSAESAKVADKDALPSTAEEIASYGTLASEAIKKGNLKLGDYFIERLIALPDEQGAKLAPLRQVAEAWAEKQTYSKAIAILEKLTTEYGKSPELPDMLLRLGQLYRSAGLNKLAINRFYSVLNSALKIDKGEFTDYKSLTLRAQLEIAETYFASGDYEQASKFFARVSLLDLKPEDKACAEFQAIHCSYFLGKYQEVVTASRVYLVAYPNAPKTPECRYLLVCSLKAVKQEKEALDEVLALLRTEQSKKASAPEQWEYWQKKTGNQVANEYYLQGDFHSALTIYQSMASLGDSPDWRWPIVYQMALCFERLRLRDRAAQAYGLIESEAAKFAGTIPEPLASLRTMAAWRAGQLQWQTGMENRLDQLLGPEPSASEDKAEFQLPSGPANTAR